MKRAKAYSPAGISSVFEIFDRTADGTAISNPLRIGARGGGFVISHGVETAVRVDKSAKDKIAVYLNGELKRAITTETVARMILKKADAHANVRINHTVQPPIGCGYGTSAAGSLSAAIALSEALDLNMTYNQIGQLAHIAEVKCRTGLGTVGPLMIGGHVVTSKPGAPGLSVIDRILSKEDYRIVTGWFGPMSTRAFLLNAKNRIRVNSFGSQAVQDILEKPTAENFMARCRRFAENIGFVTERLSGLISAMEQGGALGATQNMVGEAAHALVEEERERRVYEAARRFLPRSQIFSTAIEFQGARLI